MENPRWQDELARQKRKDLFTKIALWGGLAVFLIASIWALTVASSSNSSTTSTITAPKITTSDFQTGPATAKTTLIEYADFQCPSCKAYYPILKQLKIDFAGKVNFVYRMFPLETIHHNAQIAAQAAYAANMQHKFWEMHNKLFDTQDSWAGMTDPSSTYVGYAKDLGLNTTQFSKDMTAANTVDFVQNSYNTAMSLGLAGTPTFFINGKQITNPNGYSDFKDLINKSLK